MRASFEDFVERAPDGEVEMAGGVFRHAYRGNWKLVLENHNDTVHPAFVHASSIWAAREQPAADGEAYSEIGVRQMLQNGAPWEVWETIGLWVAGGGHSWMGDYHDDRRLRVVYPIAVDRAAVYACSFRLKGASERMYRDSPPIPPPTTMVEGGIGGRS